LERCVSDFNQNNPTFVIQLGDIIDGGANAAEELQAITSVYDQLQMPHYHALGNHDFAGIDRTSVMDILGLQRGYYRFDLRDWRFIVLDTQDIALQGGWPKDSRQYQAAVQMLDALKATGARNAIECNGAIGDKQLVWLENELANADKQNKRVIVFGHLPLMPADDPHAAWNRQKVVSVFEKYNCVKSYIGGHNHKGNYALHKGIHYVTLEAMVNAADKDGAWATVILSSDEMSIQGFGAVTTRTLQLSK
jgi:3',5'-cyclic AMP phosphodiesterase CpdA